MPTRYNPNLSTTTIHCSHCSSRVEVSGRTSGQGTDLTSDGSSVADFIRWLPARGIYHSWCRSCERAARRAQPNRAQQRAASGARNLNRPFGVELELIFPADVTRDRIRAALSEAGVSSGWNVKGDGSLSGGNGMEVVTPPLHGEDGIEELRKGMTALRSLNPRPNRSCGTHVHHDVRDLDVDAIKRFVKSWANNQSTVLDGFVSPSRRGNDGSYYCKPLSTGDVASLSRITTLQELRHGYRVQRYRTVNLQAYGRYGTVEVRQHQGTTDFEKVRSYIMLGQAMLDTAKAASSPIPSRPTVMDFMRSLGTMIDGTARTFLIGRAVEFGHVTVTA